MSHTGDLHLTKDSQGILDVLLCHHMQDRPQGVLKMKQHTSHISQVQSVTKLKD
jgi:hypothetical protein